MDATVDRRVARVSAFWYLGVSLSMVALFLALARAVGGYPPGAFYGGAVWTFVLSLIVTMPLVTASVKRRLERG